MLRCDRCGQDAGLFCFPIDVFDPDVLSLCNGCILDYPHVIPLVQYMRFLEDSLKRAVGDPEVEVRYQTAIDGLRDPRKLLMRRMR